MYGYCLFSVSIWLWVQYGECGGGGFTSNIGHYYRNVIRRVNDIILFKCGINHIFVDVEKLMIIVFKNRYD